MRTNNERTELILSGAKSLRARRKKRRTAAGHLSLFALCLALITAASLNISRTDITVDRAAADYGAATLLAQSDAVGYILIGILSFLLGICLTLLLSRIKQRDKSNDSENHHEL